MQGDFVKKRKKREKTVAFSQGMVYNIKAVQRWRSGRTRTIRNRVMQECIQGFKSLSLRQNSGFLAIFR